MNFDSNYKLLPQIFLDLILIGPQEFRDDFKNFAPIVSPQIDSFKTNPACDCRDKIINFVESNREEAFNFISNWFESNEKFRHYLGAVDPDIIEQKYLVTEVNGKIFEIEDTPEEFLIFKEKMEAEKFSYHSVHLIKVNNKLKIYFL